MNRELEQAVEAALKLDGARGNPETPSTAAAVETSPFKPDLEAVANVLRSAWMLAGRGSLAAGAIEHALKMLGEDLP